MTATREVTIWCDVGPDEASMSCGEFVTGDTAARARRGAKVRGWKVAAPGGRDYCPEHAADLTSPDSGTGA